VIDVPIRRAILIVAGVMLAAGLSPASAHEMPVSQLLVDLDAFSGRQVEVAGRVVNVRTRTSRKGQPQYTFELSDGVQSIVVYGAGAAPCRAGSDAVVLGTVETKKRVHETVGVIDAAGVSCR